MLKTKKRYEHSIKHKWRTHLWGAMQIHKNVYFSDELHEVTTQKNILQKKHVTTKKVTKYE
jgi:hypothetical protein